MESRWGLLRNPFVDPRGGAVIAATPALEEALARLEYLFCRRRRLGIVLGEPGTGKTVALQAFHRELKERGSASASITAAGCDADEAQYRFAEAFGTLKPSLRTPGDVRRAAAQGVENLALLERPFALLVDDVDHAEPGFCDALLALAKRAEHVGAPLSIAVAASPASAPANLIAQADLAIRLSRWNAEDVRNVLSEALALAGREEPAFDEQAIWRLQELAHGVPRTVIRLAELALVAGAANDRRLVTADLIDAVAEEVLPPAPQTFARDAFAD